VEHRAADVELQGQVTLGRQPLPGFELSGKDQFFQAGDAGLFEAVDMEGRDREGQGIEGLGEGSPDNGVAAAGWGWVGFNLVKPPAICIVRFITEEFNLEFPGFLCLMQTKILFRKGNRPTLTADRESGTVGSR
jgi:hypothetical protein